ASGGRHGLAQSFFQVGGNVGTAIGPLMAAFIVLPHGQRSIGGFSLIALLAILILWRIGNWYARHGLARLGTRSGTGAHESRLPRRKVWTALGVLLVLIFSKYFYLASLTSYYTFYLIDRFGVSVQTAQIYLFI